MANWKLHRALREVIARGVGQSRARFTISRLLLLCKKYLLNFALVIEKRIQSSFMLQKSTGFFSHLGHSYSTSESLRLSNTPTAVTCELIEPPRLTSARYGIRGTASLLRAPLASRPRTHVLRTLAPPTPAEHHIFASAKGSARAHTVGTHDLISDHRTRRVHVSGTPHAFQEPSPDTQELSSALGVV
jgi:hypothetical protein